MTMFDTFKTFFPSFCYTDIIQKTESNGNLNYNFPFARKLDFLTIDILLCWVKMFNNLKQDSS